MSLRHFLLLSCVYWIFSGCQSFYGLTVMESGIFDCFEEQPKDVEKTIYCETSAVAFDGERIYLASDKKVPNGSPVFDMPIEGIQLETDELNYWDDPIFTQVKKYEDFSRSPDGERFFAMTSFDRLKENESDWDKYNILLSWTLGNEADAKMIAESERDNIKSSRLLKADIASAIQSYNPELNTDYFKLEGCAAIPNNKLLFGIREIGPHYENFEYKIILLEVGYFIGDEESVELMNDWKVVYEYNTNVSDLGLRSPVGLSSIEYDAKEKCIYLLTSYELGETDMDRGAYLWVLPMNYIKQGKEPILVKDQNTQKPFEFSHKAEGIAVLDKGNLFIIHDDDKVLGETKFERAPHQAAYDIINIKKTR